MKVKLTAIKLINKKKSEEKETRERKTGSHICHMIEMFCLPHLSNRFNCMVNADSLTAEKMSVYAGGSDDVIIM